MPIGNGGIIGPANVPTLLSAKGVWSLREAQLAQRQGIWPLGLIPDPYFEYTTLLLPGNGTNGAQNNTFLDASTNNFTITRNGNTTQGTFSPFSQTGWGNYFNGTNAYLRAGTAANWAFLSNTTAAWTIEFWVYNTTSGSSTTLFDTSNSTTANVGVSIQKTSSEYVNVQIVYASAGNFIVNGTSTSTLTANTWNHVFISYNQSLASSNLVFYINGVAAGTANKTANTPSSSNPFGALSIGAYGAGGGQFFTGYLSNVRISNVVRTPPSSVPTSPYTSDADTQLLTCQSNRFVDNSTVSTKTITANGSPSVQAFSPFNPVLPWTAANNGGSGYFDGSGDYLSAASNAAFGFGTGDFTIEYWVFPSLTGDANQVVIDSRSSDTAIPWLIGQTTGGAVRYYDGTTVRTGGTMSANTWNHVAWCRVSNVNTVYLNGTSVSTYTASQDFGSSKQLTIGSNINTALERTVGYISNIRLLKGTAVYTGNFTPPSLAPLTIAGSTSAASYPSTTNVNTSFASSACSLLLNYTNAGIYDATSKNDLETVGNAQISTTQSKWGGGSISFDGTGDYLQSIPTPDLELGSGDYTVECWINISAAASNGGIVGKGPVGALTNTIWSIEFNGSANTLSVFIYNANNSTYIINGTTNVKTSTWIHVALTRSGNNTRFFINGTQEGSTYTSGYTISAGNNLYVGGGFYAPSTRTITGYIDDLRITKYARYTSNFTPPTAAFPTL